MKIQLGVIGYGGMGKWHAANAPRAGVEVAAVCDIDEEKINQGIADGFFYELSKLSNSNDYTMLSAYFNFICTVVCVNINCKDKNFIFKICLCLHDFFVCVQFYSSVYYIICMERHKISIFAQ